jgi:hypothetical protein
MTIESTLENINKNLSRIADSLEKKEKPSTPQLIKEMLNARHYSNTKDESLTEELDFYEIVSQILNDPTQDVGYSQTNLKSKNGYYTEVDVIPVLKKYGGVIEWIPDKCIIYLDKDEAGKLGEDTFTHEMDLEFYIIDVQIADKIYEKALNNFKTIASTQCENGETGLFYNLLGNSGYVLLWGFCFIFDGNDTLKEFDIKFNSAHEYIGFGDPIGRDETYHMLSLNYEKVLRALIERDSE